MSHGFWERTAIPSKKYVSVYFLREAMALGIPAVIRAPAPLRRCQLVMDERNLSKA